MDRAELQAVQLALALVLGLGLGFFYDLYRVWFRSARGAIRKGVGDIIWWLLALTYSLVALYKINGMELRLPVLVLAAAGVCLYMGFFSPVIFPGLHRLVGWMVHIVRWLWRMLGRLLALVLLPVVWAADAVLRLLGLILWILGWPFARLIKLGGRLAAVLRRVCEHCKKPAKEVDFTEENDI